VQAPESNGSGLLAPSSDGRASPEGSTPPPPGLYWELITNVDFHPQRSKSSSDASMLRRKGHLKEQDALIDFIIKMHETHTCEEAMHKMEKWMAEHKQDPRRSRLRRLIPSIGSIFLPLRLVEAFREYDSFFSLSRRKYVPPNFAEIRHVVNIAQVHASAEHIRLVTFDADGQWPHRGASAPLPHCLLDAAGELGSWQRSPGGSRRHPPPATAAGTLYADGHHIEQDSQMIGHMINLMRSNVHVGIVTAAGYPGDAAKFEQRIAGLLQAFKRLNLPPQVTSR
jgi:IMP and pyridine-specific 5'-nucleotidase